MHVNYKKNGQDFQCDLNHGIDLSSTLNSNENYARAWGVPPVKVTPVKRDGWVGAVAQGSPVNFFDITFNPHGNGTHTECVGHITPEHHALEGVLQKFHFMARLEHLLPREVEGDKIIYWEDVQTQITTWDFEALIIAVPTRWPVDFTDSNPTYFEPEVLKQIRERGVKHFITNLPSVDREEDGGALQAHHAFWNYPQELDRERTITELAHLPRSIASGYYLLNLQVAHFNNDASPSRPVIFPVNGG